jgi:hypothetical protein
LKKVESQQSVPEHERSPSFSTNNSAKPKTTPPGAAGTHPTTTAKPLKHEDIKEMMRKLEELNK